MSETIRKESDVKMRKTDISAPLTSPEQNAVPSRGEIPTAGSRFGRWVVIGPAPNKSRNSRCVCKCDCGMEREVFATSLRTGKTKSCGCLSKELAGTRATTHGHSRLSGYSGEYISWTAAKTRCFNTKDSNYRKYGAREITMCDEWKNSFELFLKYMGPRPEGTSLGRINNDGNYEPGNCRWETMAQQRNNSRQNVFVTFYDQTKTVQQWADILGVNHQRIRKRLSDKISPEVFFFELNQAAASMMAESAITNEGKGE